MVRESRADYRLLFIFLYKHFTYSIDFSIGYSVFPSGSILFGAYQLLSVLLLATASMTAFQDTQATARRDVAIGEIPQFVCHRDKKGTFTRSITATFVISVLIMIMGLAIRRHVLAAEKG